MCVCECSVFTYICVGSVFFSFWKHVIQYFLKEFPTYKNDVFPELCSFNETPPGHFNETPPGHFNFLLKTTPFLLPKQ